jgi:glyoxylase-like metal-dependent hydrolase (beta-lactamase superfamily II)
MACIGQSPAKVHVALGGGYLQCTSYLIESPQGAVLVDPGSGACQEQLLASIRRIVGGIDEVRAILLTHCHVDHARGAYRLRGPSRSLIASAYTAQVLRAGGGQVWYEFPQYVIPTLVDQTVGDGEVINICGLSIRAVHTPGHTPGCTSYLVDTADGLAAFTGDLITGDGSPGWAGSEGFSVPDTLRSLRKLLDAAPDRAFWGHGVANEPAATWLARAIELGESGRWQLYSRFHPDIPPPDGFERRQ